MTEYLVPNMTLEQVIAYCKKYPHLVNKTEIGRKVLLMISRGDTKWLRRFWQGVAVKQKSLDGTSVGGGE